MAKRPKLPCRRRSPKNWTPTDLSAPSHTNIPSSLRRSQHPASTDPLPRHQKHNGSRFYGMEAMTYEYPLWPHAADVEIISIEKAYGICF